MDDFLEPEVAVAVAVTAAVCSPPVRKVLRTGLVYGLAGLIIARDRASQTASAVKKSVQHAAEGVGQKAVETAAEAAGNKGAEAVAEAAS